MTTKPDHPAVIHGRSFALIQHALRGDKEAVAVLAAEPLADPTAAVAQILSLVQVAALLLSHVPEQERQQLLDEAAVALALAEGDGVA